LAERVSVHESVLEMYERLQADGMSNAFDRYAEQDSIRCKFCLDGVSCQLCANGPCRLTDRIQRGVCGIERNGMAMRNMLLRNVMGTATYTYHAYDAFKTLQAAGQGKTLFKIKDPEKLLTVAKAVEVDVSGTPEAVAVRLAEFFIGEMNRGYDEPSKLITAFAPKPRQELWRKLGIFPAGPMHEIKDSTASCLTNVDGDYVSLAKKAMRLGIACIYGSQIPLELTQDILFGTPYPHESQADLGILDPAYVNLLFNGHEPFVGAAMIELAKRPDNQAKAKAAGAKGIKVIGSIECGQEILQRYELDDVFGGLMGDWLSIEPLLATGAVDIFAMDENCSPPYIYNYADKYQVTLASVSRIVRIHGVDNNFDYKPPEAESIAQKLLDLGIGNFRARQGRIPPKVPAKIRKVLVGFSPEAILRALGGTLDPLIDVLKAGKIKGVAALVSCTVLKDGPQGSLCVNLAKELLRRDILVLAAGCGNATLQVAGLTSLETITQAGPGLQEICRALNIPPVLSFGTCTDTGRLSLVTTALAAALGVDSSDLPVVVTAPEYMEQKATIDALFALAYGLYTHVAPTPPITGAPELVKLLTEDLEGITGGKVALGHEPAAVAEAMEAHIMKKRQALGI